MNISLLYGRKKKKKKDDGKSARLGYRYDPKSETLNMHHG
jgi:hypothetical protein